MDKLTFINKSNNNPLYEKRWGRVRERWCWNSLRPHSIFHSWCYEFVCKCAQKYRKCVQNIEQFYFSTWPRLVCSTCKSDTQQMKLTQTNGANVNANHERTFFFIMTTFIFCLTPVTNGGVCRHCHCHRCRRPSFTFWFINLLHFVWHFHKPNISSRSFAANVIYIIFQFSNDLSLFYFISLYLFAFFL